MQTITTQVAVCRPAAMRGFTPPVWLVSGLLCFSGKAPMMT